MHQTAMTHKLINNNKKICTKQIYIINLINILAHIGLEIVNLINILKLISNMDLITN